MSKLHTLTSKSVLRVFFSVLLLLFVFEAVDFQALWRVLTRMSLPGAIAVSLLYALGQVLSAWKWSFFVAKTPLAKRRTTLLRAYAFGMFVNTFGLGTIGGDLTRALLLRPQKAQRALAISTVVADRLHGLLVLFAIGCCGVVLVAPKPIDSGLVRVAALSGLALIALMVLAYPFLRARAANSSRRLIQKVRGVLSSLAIGRTTLIQVTVLSIAVHSLQILMHVVIAEDLRANLPLLFFIAVVPIVNIASSLPFSINGIGVREALYVLFFVPQGVSAEVAIAFGAIWLVSVTLVSALGGLLLPPEIRREFKEMQWSEGAKESTRRVA